MKLKEPILIIGAHVDDGEFGCGGTIARLVEDAHSVAYAVLSPAIQSLQDGMPSDTTEKEMHSASALLGLKWEDCRLYDFPVRLFPFHRQPILELLVELQKEIRPGTVIMPCQYDTHQDHHTIFEEGFRAFKRSATILGYEMPDNMRTFSSAAFVVLQDRHFQVKQKAVNAYKSQKWRGHGAHLRSLAQLRGAQVGAKYAEAFEVIQWII